MKINSFKCCFNCTKRTVGCHSTCEEYKATKEELYNEQKKTYEGRVKDSIYTGYAVNAARKAKRRKNGK